MRRNLAKIVALSALIVLILSAFPVFAANFRETQRKANNGDAQAQFELGEMYHDGDGVKQNYKEAMKWYLKASKQDILGADNNMG